MWVTTEPQAVHGTASPCGGRGSYPSRFLRAIVLQNTLTVMHDQCVTAPPKDTPSRGAISLRSIDSLRFKKAYAQTRIPAGSIFQDRCHEGPISLP